MPIPDVDFHRIRSLGGSQSHGFEEFCCQIAARKSDVPPGSHFHRIRGDGGDGGVECYWQLPGGAEWGWQAKFIWELDKSQLDASVTTALSVHPKLTRYFICLPFDPTGPTNRSLLPKKSGRRSQSDTEKITAWIELWKAAAAGKGMTVEFVLCWKANLLDSVLGLPFANERLRFWFDSRFFGERWFQQQLNSAIGSAGPRYSAALNVTVPLHYAFDAFGKTERWQETVLRQQRELRKAANTWRERSATAPEKLNGLTDETTSRIAELNRKLGDVEAAFQSLADGTAENGEDLQSLARELHPFVDAVEVGAARDMNTKHGKAVADSESFRHWIAEYEAEFPDFVVDHVRELKNFLETITSWIGNTQFKLTHAKAMLIVGPAGVGKTHAICDAASQRLAQGLPSIVTLGEQFTDGDPWNQMLQLLGLPGDWSRIDLLAALDVAGEWVGRPAILFIDALNETTPRRMWQSHLARVVADIEPFPWVKLCLSCRTAFVDRTIPDTLRAMLQVNHKGFAGIEVKACREFFSFYHLDLPSMPLMQPEFSNGLFLKLVCEALQKQGLTTMPVGLHGITDVMNLFVAANERHIANLLDYDVREGKLAKAIDTVIAEMQTTGRRHVPWERAKSLIDGPTSLPRSQSPFHHILGSSILVEDRIALPETGNPQDVVRFGFERFADHFITKQLLSAVSPDRLKESVQGDGPLAFVFADENAVQDNAGLIAELCVQLPERFGIELPDMDLEEFVWERLLEIWAASLVWRAPQSITAQTRDWLIETLRTRGVGYVAMDSLLSLVCRPEHPLNMRYQHGLWTPMTMPDRDGFLCPYLHDSFDEHSTLDRLLDWAMNGPLDALTQESAELWLSQLAWCCCAADRRVRDKATKAMVRVGEHQPSCWAPVIEAFLKVNDEYVVERVLAAAYGSLIRSDRNDALQAAATIVWNDFFTGGTRTANAMIRDFARLILEFAQLRGVLPNEATPAQFRPPYASAWPLDIPDDSWLNQYRDSDDALPRLLQSCTQDDFGRYTLGSVNRPFWETHDAGDQIHVGSWVFREVLNLGYESNDVLRNYDRAMLGRFGFGRGRKKWAERIGKKYQWIALFRLIGHVEDHADASGHWAGTIPHLQADSERNIDCTHNWVRKQPDSATAWWFPSPYDFTLTQNQSNDNWVSLIDDIPAGAEVLQVQQPEAGREWFVLSTFHRQSSRTEEEEEEDGPCRLLSRSIYSFLVPNSAADMFWIWLQTQDLDSLGLSLHSPPNPSESAWIGEYPWAAPLAEFVNLPDYQIRNGEVPCEVWATSCSLGAHNEYDASQSESIHIRVPGKRFFASDQLRWNKDSGYLNQTGQVVFNDPSRAASGPGTLVVTRDFLNQFLASNQMSLFCSIISEKYCRPRRLSFDDSSGMTHHHQFCRYTPAIMEFSMPTATNIRNGTRTQLISHQ